MWSGTAQRTRHDMTSKNLKKKTNTNFQSKKLDEATVRAMIRTAVKVDSLGDDKIRFVLKVASDETSCIAGRAFGEADKDKHEQGTASSSPAPESEAAVKIGLHDGEEHPGVRTKTGAHGEATPQQMEQSRSRFEKCLTGRAII